VMDTGTQNMLLTGWRAGTEEISNLYISKGAIRPSTGEELPNHGSFPTRS
jgi:hypothetical protein